MGASKGVGMTREEELNLIKKERDEMIKHMTDMFDLAFMLNNRNDVMNPQAHYEKLSRMVTHYMGSIQQSYGYMADKTIKALEQEPCNKCVYSTKNGECQYDDIAETIPIEQEPYVEPLERLAESTAKTAKALERLSEQEHILDKIRTEIEAEMEKNYGYDIATAQGIRTGSLSAISIIDKYRK